MNNSNSHATNEGANVDEVSLEFPRKISTEL